MCRAYYALSLSSYNADNGMCNRTRSMAFMIPSYRSTSYSHAHFTLISVILIIVYLRRVCSSVFFFFFQAEDGIRDYKVTGVQTCALPIYLAHQGRLGGVRKTLVGMPSGQCRQPLAKGVDGQGRRVVGEVAGDGVSRREIGRASCRERV